MKRSLFFLCLFFTGSLLAQPRYLSEIYSQVTVTSDVEYGLNVDFLTSTLNDPAQIQADLTEIGTALQMGNPIPPKFFNPADTNSDIKLKRLNLDVYEATNDTAATRPLVVYVHTGNFLPPPLNGSPVGQKTDSLAVEICKRFAKRGFVAASVAYRHGWNPFAGTALERRATLLNAVYRAIQDVKHSVRFLKANSGNYKIDKNKVILVGEGSGGYVVLAYATLDKPGEIAIPKFVNPATGNSYIDTNAVGDFEGFGGTLNLYSPNGENSDIHFTVNMGGALADTSWLEAGDVPMVSVQCVRDPFAPYDEGTVIVPTTNEDVVDVQGQNVFIPKANALGNNTGFASINDSYSAAARSRYGNTYSYIYAPPEDQITLSTNLEGGFPVLIPKAPTIFQNTGAPWQWWAPNGPLGSAVVDQGPPPVTAHQAGLVSNPNMSSTQGRTYADTIMGYSVPRIVAALNLKIDLNEYALNSKVDFYPNPVKDIAYISITDGDITPTSLEIMDLTGKTVRAISLAENQYEVDLSGLTRGVYFAKLITEEGNALKKIVKD